jgi:hypothetical protein
LTFFSDLSDGGDDTPERGGHDGHGHDEPQQQKVRHERQVVDRPALPRHRAAKGTNVMGDVAFLQSCSQLLTPSNVNLILLGTVIIKSNSLNV